MTREPPPPRSRGYGRREPRPRRIGSDKPGIDRFLSPDVAVCATFGDRKGLEPVEPVITVVPAGVRPHIGADLPQERARAGQTGTCATNSPTPAAPVAWVWPTGAKAELDGPPSIAAHQEHAGDR